MTDYAQPICIACWAGRCWECVARWSDRWCECINSGCLDWLYLLQGGIE